VEKIKITSVIGISILFIIIFGLSGCCPYSKKKTSPVESKQALEQPSEQPARKPSTQPDVTTREIPGVATPTEVATATTGGEIPPVKSAEQPKFVEPARDVQHIFQPVYFDFDRYEIKTSEQGKLKTLAEYLKQNSDVSILIEGHCDERGTDEYNLVLGEKRALSTRNFLVGLGISPKRLYTISYGEAQPADPGHNEEAWAKNRRAEFKIKQ